jgi:hypothetical protein
MEITLKNSAKFYCKSCDFRCCKNVDWGRHLLTRKHINRTMINNLEQQITPDFTNRVFVCKKCNKEYKARNSLWYHENKCNKLILLPNDDDIKNVIKNVIKEDNIKIEISKESSDGFEDFVCKDDKVIITKDMFMTLVKNSEEMMKIIKEQQLAPPSLITNNNTTNHNHNNNTTNNTFNLNFFLNEKCKDALNMSEFVDSLKITLDDLLFSKTNGISRGVTDVMIKGLKQLDIYKRPIHCTDVKRDTMYIKDEDKWQKDNNHDKMRNTIIKIADKERTALQQWAIDNPDWMETEQKQIKYLTMVRSICEPIENYENYERKIVKNLGKEILVDK